jgi:hypothetical protein
MGSSGNPLFGQIFHFRYALYPDTGPLLNANFASKNEFLEMLLSIHF